MSANAKLHDPAQQVPSEANATARATRTAADEGCKDQLAGARAMADFDEFASDLYNLASMLVGEGEDSIQLIEAAVASVDKSHCSAPEEGRKATRLSVMRRGVQILADRDVASLAAPAGFEPAQTCIEDDDLSSAGVSRDELNQMMSGPDRDRVRTWLESLPTATRTIFVLRAVGGCNTAETAGLLAEFGGPQAANWTPDAIREFFRQGLCSLASQLIHAGNRA